MLVAWVAMTGKVSTIDIERLEQMRRFARRHALGLLEQRKASTMTEEQALELALEAQRSARKPPRKRRRTW